MTGKSFTAFLAVAVGLSALLLLPSLLALRPVGIDQGYSPSQPIAFSHRLHAGELEIACLYCHYGAEKSRNAGIPALQTCMNCHSSVAAPFADVRAEADAADREKRRPRPVVSPEIKKIYAALGLNSALEPDPSLKPAPVAWRRVHNLPDFAYFDHRPHVSAGVDCRQCHGPVDAMERVSQDAPMTMGWCVNCHRNTPIAAAAGGKPGHPSTDCARCHY